MGAMSTAMQRGEACHVAQFQIPSKAAPLTFAYALHARRGEQWRVVTPARGGHFTVQIGVQEGSAGKLGPSLTEDGTLNFAVECRGGDYVNLVLVRATSDGPEASGASGAAGVKLEEFALDPSTNRTGVVWHAAVRDTGDIVGYGWRVNGDLGWEQGARVVRTQFWSIRRRLGSSFSTRAMHWRYFLASKREPARMRWSSAGSRRRGLTVCHLGPVHRLSSVAPA